MRSTTLKALAARTLPAGYTLDYAGPSRQFVQESTGVMGTFGFAIIIAFLTLAALYESFRDPLVILISVPLSIAGALIFIALGVHGASLNIYTQVGLVTLIGLISKHGILIVEVANEEQQSGKSKRDAIVAAAGLRLRPILMTTAAMVLGVIPLVFAQGAGGASRYAIGLVISTGLGIGTLVHAVRGARGLRDDRRHPLGSRVSGRAAAGDALSDGAVRAPDSYHSNCYNRFAKLLLEKVSAQSGRVCHAHPSTPRNVSQTDGQNFDKVRVAFCRLSCIFHPQSIDLTRLRGVQYPRNHFKLLNSRRS